MTIYKSKIGIGILLFIVIVIGGTSALMIFVQAWPGLVINLVAIAFITHLYFTTYYKVYDKTLVVKCGFFFNRSIDIETIKEIKETNNPIGSPATSLDQLEIRYNKYDTIIISPKRKTAFIDHLLIINPTITIKMKPVPNKNVV